MLHRRTFPVVRRPHQRRDADVDLVPLGRELVRRILERYLVRTREMARFAFGKRLEKDQANG